MNDMAQIDHSKGDEMSAKETRISAFEPYQQSFEFIDPGKRSFRSEAVFVDFCIEQSFTTSFGGLAVASVFIHIWDQSMIETGFTSFLGIERFVGIEESALNGKPQTFHGFEGGL